MKNITLDAFKNQQNKANEIQSRLLSFLSEGEAAGVTVDPALRDKLNHSLSGNKDLKIALVGGFSEGKTSIAAAWLGKIDKSTMNISHQESSNAVAVYKIEEGLTLIDTPGLFGYKEKLNANSEEIEKYKDITKKYVSEAHLVLYVMNGANPLKESHKEDLNWLFRDLSLLPRTVFVLSRFDEVADVADEDDYQENVTIKKQNIRSRLKDLVGLNDEEASDLSIVAVSANPFDAGIEYWLTEPDRFQELSHIALLQQATADKIESNGGPERMALETSKSIIRDVLMREIPIAVEKDEVLEVELDKLLKATRKAEDDAQTISKKIASTQIALREFTLEHFTDLILQLDGCSMETIPEFFEREIGDEGIILDTKVQNAFSKRIGAVNSELVKIQASLDSNISAFDSHMATLGRQGLNYVAKSGVINAGSIKAARDMLGLGFKFKPWGAVKLAKGLNGAVAVVGIGFELWDSYQAAERERKFQETKSDMKKNLEGQRKELLERISADTFSSDFFPDFVALQEKISSLHQAVEETTIQRKAFSEWRNNAEIIEGEFSVLSH